ncbi:MAG: hypothetical protein A2827_03190 [Candidatus Spechtbacteria bacterium RIFCSPHIGHO2_01_FULL_43_30]|uniref:Amidohydrolase-related domain-containing protein n=1 Tax=Candidatus Spechtbacteria bacterium RIFCSPHIGHO2_01_FULL_43_30 TaxID=1802158 RepID=A0A1G2H829_9BACT|nr:MAG: hypothetical protein A2827_03190 [Candidatus Spechtbacteria bacterium RIFCSPHIGHO2_01_FULL_43_30]
MVARKSDLLYNFCAYAHLTKTKSEAMMEVCLDLSHEAPCYSPIDELKKLVFGGIVDCHGHAVTENTSTQAQYDKRGKKDLELDDIWVEIGKVRKEALATLVRRLNYSITRRRAMGICAWQTYVDVGPDIDLDALNVCIEAKRLWRRYGFTLKIAVYPTLALKNTAMDALLREACRRQEVDSIGFLPSRERQRGVVKDPAVFAEMERAFEIAAEFGKGVDMQVDQKNHPEEKETFYLANIAARYRDMGYKKPICATHCLSMSAWNDDQLISYTLTMMAESNVSMIVCPRATLDNLQIREVLAPTHNSIAPWTLALKAKVNVAVGIDNVRDLYMPWCDGDIWKDVSVLVHSARYHGSIEKIADMLTINGKKALGL